MEYDRWDVEPGESPDVLIFAHGLGGNGTETMKMVNYLLDTSGHAAKDGLIVLTPHGPFCWNGSAKGGMRGWYQQIKDDMIRLDMLENSLQALDFMIQDILSGKELGVPAKSVCLAGFSQGGTVAVSYPLMYPGKTACAGNFAGYIPRELKINTEVPPEKYGIIVWGHGTQDYCNDYYLAEWGLPQLERLRVSHTHLHDPVGHTVRPRWFKEMMEQWLGKIAI